MTSHLNPYKSSTVTDLSPFNLEQTNLTKSCSAVQCRQSALLSASAHSTALHSTTCPQLACHSILSKLQGILSRQAQYCHHCNQLFGLLCHPELIVREECRDLNTNQFSFGWLGWLLIYCCFVDSILLTTFSIL